jgi:hypothetical protein
LFYHKKDPSPWPAAIARLNRKKSSFHQRQNINRYGDSLWHSLHNVMG